LELIVIYQILNDVGEVINRIVADEAFVEAAYPGRYRLEGPESLIVDPAIITKIAMITRFLDAEYTGILSAAKTDVEVQGCTKIAMITRFLDAEYTGILSAAKTDVEVQGWLDRFYAAGSIDLGDTRTVDGINMMVSKGLLVPARATEILTAPVRPDEKPQ